MILKSLHFSSLLSLIQNFCFVWICALSFSATAQSNENEFCQFSQKRLFNGIVKVYNLGPTINTAYSEYTTVFNSDEQLMFYTSRIDSTTGQDVSRDDHQSYEDIMFSRLENRLYRNGAILTNRTDLFPFTFNSSKHDAPVFLSGDDSTFIFYKQEKLWFATLTDTGYTDAILFPKSVNIGDYQRHATISKSDSIIYFTTEVRDKKIDRTHFDIYASKMNAKGTWEKPVALPGYINTPYNEDSPIISADGKSMYFSSDKPGGLGGYDVYYTELQNDTWSLPVSLCEPINSPAHDIYFNMSKSDNYAYFSSNRLGGYGKFDLYKVIVSKPDFEDCEMMSLGAFAGFDLSDGIDPDGAPLEYEWDFGDGGRKEYGPKVEHLFKYPGEYTVSMTAIDAKLGVRYENQFDTTINVELKSGTVFIDVPDTVAVGEKFWVDGSRSRLNGKRPDQFYWKADTLFFEKTDRFKVTFQEEGLYEIRVDAIVVNEEFIDLENKCLIKRIQVVSKAEAADYRSNQGFASSESDLYSRNESKINMNSPKKDGGITLINDFENTLEGKSVRIYALTNDKATNGSALTLSLNSLPSNGDVALNVDHFIYTPDHDFVGSDAFTYNATTKEGLKGKATIVITVKSENDYFKHSSAKNLVTRTTADSSVILDIPGVSGGSPEILARFIRLNKPKNGTLVIADSTNGVLKYVPNSGFEGSESFAYQTRDKDGFLQSALYQVSVGSVTEVSSPDKNIKSVAANESAMFDLLTNEPGSATIQSVSGAFNGKVKIVDPKTGRVIYVPNPGYVGNDAFTYTILKDGKLQTIGANVFIGTTDNGSIITSAPDFASTEPSMPVDISLLLNDVNANGTGLMIYNVQSPANGKVIVKDAEKGIIEYVPNKGFVGKETFEYTVKDQNGVMNKSTVSIDVIGSASDLVGLICVDDVFETKMDVPVEIEAFINDKHTKGSSFKLVSVTDASSGVVKIDNASKGKLTYIPSPGFEGEDRFVYEALDASGKKSRAQVVVRVLPQFDATAVNTKEVAELGLKPIYFNFDDKNIRPEEFVTLDSNIKILKANPKAVLKIVSHCDSRGRTEYNMALSTKRAKSTVEYLTSHGLSAERILAVLGVGESQLANPCGDGVDCPDSDHQENRRSDFIVIGTLK